MQKVYKNLIYIKRNALEPRIQFNYFEQLQDSLDLNSKKLTLQLKVDEINEEKISKLTSIFKKFKGKKSLEFDLFESMLLLLKKLKRDLLKVGQASWVLLCFA